MDLVPVHIPTQWGGTGGTPFNSFFARLGRIKRIQLYQGKYYFWTVVRGLEVFYNISNEVDRFGSCTGTPDASLLLDQDEVIIFISGRYGSYLDSLTLATNFGQTVKCGGTGGKYEFNFRAPASSFINGFHGAAGAVIDRIGVILMEPSTRTQSDGHENTKQTKKQENFHQTSIQDFSTQEEQKL